MILGTYIIAVLVFCVAFVFSNLTTTCHEIGSIARSSFSTLTDKSLDDAEKEKQTQASAISMTKNLFIVLGKLIIVLCLTFLPIFLSELLGLATISETTEFSLRIDVLVITTVLIISIVFLKRKVKS